MEKDMSLRRRLLRRKKSMAMKFKYNSKDEVPAELVSLYAERRQHRASRVILRLHEGTFLQGLRTGSPFFTGFVW